MEKESSDREGKIERRSKVDVERKRRGGRREVGSKRYA